MTKVRIRRHRPHHDKGLLRVVVVAVGIIGIGIVVVPWTVSLSDAPPLFPDAAMASPRVRPESTKHVFSHVKEREQDVEEDVSAEHEEEPWREKGHDPPVEEISEQRMGRDKYHTVISTGCSTFQDWQSYVFFYHLLHSGQEGPVTRIASGCNDEDAHTLTDIFEKEIATMAPGRFRLHLTPDFSRIKRGTVFKYVRVNCWLGYLL
jgi:hypothetical protein